MMTKNRLFLAAILLLPGTAAVAQTAVSETIAVPLTDPARPMTLDVSLMTGGVSVEGYDGTEVLIDARERAADEEPAERRDGMMRIPSSSVGLTIEERANEVSISADWSSRPIDLEVRVPRNASLQVRTVNGGDIVVRGVAGAHELANTNGSISALDVSGSVVANTTNGGVKVAFVRMDADQPMSFTTWNGDVDVTLPASLRADLKLEAGRGEVLSDFAVELEPVATRVERDQAGARFRVRVERAVEGKVGGGGPELHFKTFNGSIYLRKAGGS